MKRLNKGYSLIELLVSLTLMGIVVVVATGMFFTTVKTKYQTETYTILKQSGDHAVNVMTKEIKNAVADLNNPNDQTLTFTDIDGNPVVLYCNYGIKPYSIIFTKSGATSYLIADNLLKDSCHFAATTSDPPVVTIDFTLEKSSIVFGSVPQQFKKSISLRTY